MNPRKETEDVLEWLRGGPSLAALKSRFPAEWEAVADELAAIFAGGKPEQLQAYMTGLAAPLAAQPNRVGQRPNQQKLEAAAITRLIRRRMAHLALKGYVLSAAAGGKHGKIRFNWFNGFVAQKLLFARELERKPVSLFWFRLIWPLVWQKPLLMPLVEAKGIYCFYSKPLIEALAHLIGGRECLEIAAGDGTLSRFLAAEGVKATATDDYSWKHAVSYPEMVLKMDAAQALRKFKPAVVICSWPPANNGFERLVFTQPGVELYIVIGSRHTFASGNWADYRAQTTFELEEDTCLGRGVLPPELGGTAYLFRKRGT
ncbi:MAG: SAM-dependent methyltransferase [Pseudomonadota bacterium]|nr:SAM-dependent methyltransferase [Pseudomonadota bacterium]